MDDHKRISPFFLAVVGVLLATVLGLSLALNRTTDIITRLEAKVTALARPPAPNPQASRRPQAEDHRVSAIDIGKLALELGREVPEVPDKTVTYYQSKFGTVQLRVLGRGQRLPLHVHRTASVATVIVSGAPQVSHRYQRQGKPVTLSARYPPGTVLAAAAASPEEWVNDATDSAQASLVFSAPAYDGEFFLGPNRDELLGGTAPAVLDLPARLAQVRSAAPGVSVAGFGPMGERLSTVVVAARGELGPFPDPAFVYVLAGQGSLTADRELPLAPTGLVSLPPHAHIALTARGGSPLALLLFRPEHDGVSDILKLGEKRYSQFNEELVIREFFHDRKGGFFLDVGAGDYQHYSTTYYLEERLGWHGIAVDALASYAAGYAAHRPNTKFVNYLVTDRAKGMQKFFEATGLTEISSVSKAVTEEQNRLLGNPDKVTEVEVPTITLTELLTKLGAGRLDLLSMDIEEHEPQALAGFDIERWQPALVCVEAHPSVQRQLQSYFARHGYVRLDQFLPYDELNWYFAPKAGRAAEKP